MTPPGPSLRIYTRDDPCLYMLEFPVHPLSSYIPPRGKGLDTQVTLHDFSAVDSTLWSWFYNRAIEQIKGNGVGQTER